MTPVRIGLVGLGLEAYWPQFPGLHARLLAQFDDVAARLAGPRRKIIHLGLVDSSAASLAAAGRARREEVDLLLVYVTTYALSSIALPVIKRARCPVILLNLQPAPALDYDRLNALDSRTQMTGEWLAFCAACPVPEIANVLRRLDLAFHQITGTLLPEDPCWLDIDNWLCAAEVVHSLAHARLGLLGHYYGGMLDIATDLAQVAGRFDVHIEQLEIDELTALRSTVSEEEVTAKLATFHTIFAIQPGCTPTELTRAARTAVALDLLVAQHDLHMMAYFHSGTGVPANGDTITSIILGTSLLTGSGIPVAGEYEVKNVLAMKILDLLGAGGSFTEFYAIDFTDDVVLMGHDGPGHPGIAQDRIKVRPLDVYHGKTGAGLSVEITVRHGPVTLLSIVEDPARGFFFLLAEGESVPGPTLEIGNTNSRYRFPLGARGFVEAWSAQGPAHHCAIGAGHLAETLTRIATLLNQRAVRVC